MTKRNPISWRALATRFLPPMVRGVDRRGFGAMVLMLASLFMATTPDPAMGGGPCVDDVECDDNNACTHDRCVEGLCAHPVVPFGDTNNDRTVGIDDLRCVLDAAAGFVKGCTFADADIAGAACGSDGLVDGLDIEGVIRAYDGTTVCTCECLTRPQCDDGVFCNGVETCLGSGVCAPGSDCQGQACDEPGNACFVCSVNSDCSDGVFCNGVETCAGGMCAPGDAPCGAGQFCDEDAGCVNSAALVTCRPLSSQVVLGDVAVIEVFVRNVPNLRGYELSVAGNVLPGGNGTAVVANIGVDAAHLGPDLTPDYVFEGLTPVEAIDPNGSRLMSMLDGGAVTVGPNSRYLGTFAIDFLPDTTEGSVFDIRVTPSQSALRSVSGAAIPFDVGPSCQVTIGDDCDVSGLPDACDLDCGPPGGPCNVPGCGGRNDCNLNGVPDVCDINSGVSLDLIPPFNTPDECVFWVGPDGPSPAGGAGFWSVPTNWSSGFVPMPSDSVVIEGPLADVTLDINAVVQTLILQDSARLRVTNFGADGDLAVTGTGGMLVRGELWADHDRTIDASGGSVVIGSNGSYRADPGGDGTNAAFLANTLTVKEGLPFESPGTIELTSQMTFEVADDVVIDGTNAGSCAPSPLATNCTPPIIRGQEDSQFAFDKSLMVKESAEIELTDGVPGPSSASGPSGPGSFRLVLGGDFVNESVHPECFDVEEGSILLDGTLPRVFEVGGFVPSCGSEAGGNFNVGRLTIGPGAIVTFRDDFDNDGSGQGVRESLTVFDLTLESGANVTIEDCNVFFAALADNGATVTLVGLAAFLSTCDIPTMSQWGLIVLALLVTIAGTLVFNRPKTKSVALWRRKK